jgi:hypothetical protein
LINFITKFRFYSPYNAFLIRIQRPGASFVAPASRWQRLYHRYIKPNANPIAILQPMGPVMFVFDVSDTEPDLKNPQPLPKEIENPFAVKGRLGNQLKKTLINAKRDGIRTLEQDAGSQSAGSIRRVVEKNLLPLAFESGKDKNGNPITHNIPIRYDIVLNNKHSPEAQYPTVVHELAHLYCGHLGTPNKKWWPDRRFGSAIVEEFEAESVAYLVCERIGIESPSAKYLSGYMGENKEIPQISLECVMKTAGLIEQMGRGTMKPRVE